MLEKALAVVNKMVEDHIIEDYAIGGAIAALFFIEPFETLHLDIVVFLPQEEMSKAVVTLTPLYNYLRDLGYNEEKEYVIIETIPVQFLVGGKPLLDDAVKTAVPKSFGAIPTKVMRVEYLLALMADRCQAKDKARAQLVREQGVEVDYDLVDAIIKEHHLEAKWKKTHRSGGLNPMSDREKSLEISRERSLQCKAERRLRLAREPIEKKIERLIQLQKIANEVRRAAGRPVRRVWGNAETEG